MEEIKARKAPNRERLNSNCFFVLFSFARFRHPPSVVRSWQAPKEQHGVTLLLFLNNTLLNISSSVSNLITRFGKSSSRKVLRLKMAPPDEHEKSQDNADSENVIKTMSEVPPRVYKVNVHVPLTCYRLSKILLSMRNNPKLGFVNERSSTSTASQLTNTSQRRIYRYSNGKPAHIFGEQN